MVRLFSRAEKKGPRLAASSALLRSRMLSPVAVQTTLVLP